MVTVQSPFCPLIIMKWGVLWNSFASFILLRYIYVDRIVYTLCFIINRMICKEVWTQGNIFFFTRERVVEIEALNHKRALFDCREKLFFTYFYEKFLWIFCYVPFAPQEVVVVIQMPEKCFNPDKSANFIHTIPNIFNIYAI